GYETSYIQIDTQMAASRIVIELIQKRSSTTSLRPGISVREFLVPKTAREEFDRARKELRGGNCTKAIAHFEQGLRIFEEDASAHNDVGNCYRKLGKLDKAEESFKRAGALSDSVYIRLNLAEVYTSQERFNEAELVLLEAVRKGSYAGDAYYGLALVYFKQNLLEKAVAAGLQAHDFPHQVADVHLVLAEIYLRERKSADALQQLQMYLKEAPNGALSEPIRQLVKSGNLDNPKID